MPELKDIIENLGKSFAEFREENDKRLEELAKGKADVVLAEKVERLNDAIGELETLKRDVEALEKRANRPGNSGQTEPDEVVEARARHRKAFDNFIRSSADPDAIRELRNANEEVRKLTKAVNITTNADGGYAVPEEIARSIHEKIVDISPMRQDCRVVPIGTPDYKELVDVNGTSSGWVGEGDARSETSTPGLQEVAPTYGIVYAYPKASEESLMDIFFSVEDWLERSVVREFARQEGVAFVSGNGTKKPTGFLNGSPSTIGDEDSPARDFGVLQFFPTGVADNFANSRVDSPPADPGDVFFDALYALKRDYRANARWRFNKATAGTIRKFKDADGNYLWQPGLIAGQPSTLLGYPISEDEAMPDVGSGAFPVAIGDWQQGYLIVDLVSSMRITRDEITTPGYVKFYMRRRVGGKLVNDDAIKLIKCATS